MANYTYLDTQVNKAIGDDAPAVYFKTVMEQFDSGTAEIGNIMSMDALNENIAENALPPEIIMSNVQTSPTCVNSCPAANACKNRIWMAYTG